MLQKIQFMILALLQILRIIPSPAQVEKRQTALGNNPVQTASVPRVKHVPLGEAIVEVKSLPFEWYLNIIPRLDNILAVSATAFVGGSIDPLAILKVLTSHAQDELYEILSTASGLDFDTVRQAPLADIIRYVKALYEVNEVDYIAGEIGPALKQTKEKLLGMVADLRAGDRTTGS